MASQTQGIQQLLAAEKRAAEKVSEARRRKILCIIYYIFHMRSSYNNLLNYKVNKSA
jgi:hypothetical protein